jgi:hypothetical protein
MAACPFCGVDARAVARKAEPLRCATCKRIYAAALIECPFCAQPAAHSPFRGGPSRREQPSAAPPLDIGEGKTESASPLLYAAAIALVPIAGALGVSRVYTTNELPIFQVCCLVAALPAFGLLYLLSRRAALSAARAWAVPFFLPTGGRISRAIAIAPWTAITVVFASAIYAVGIPICALAARAPVTASCSAVLRGSIYVTYRCSTPESAGFGGRLSGESPARTLRAFEITAREGPFGIWFVDPSSVRPPQPNMLRR